MHNPQTTTTTTTIIIIKVGSGFYAFYPFVGAISSIM